MFELKNGDKYLKESVYELIKMAANIFIFLISIFIIFNAFSKDAVNNWPPKAQGGSIFLGLSMIFLQMQYWLERYKKIKIKTINKSL